MRICIPTDGWQDASGRIAEHFGHAERFAVLDTRSGRLKVVENTANRDRPGGCRAVRQVRDLGVDAMVCREVGANAFEALTKAGIVLYHAPAATIEGVAVAASEGRLTPFRRVRSCQRGNHGHNGHQGGHGCGGHAAKDGADSQEKAHGCTGERIRHRHGSTERGPKSPT